MARALIIVDVQNDFVGDDIFGDGVLQPHDAPQIAARIARVMNQTYQRNLAVIAEQAKIDVMADPADYTYILATQDWHVDAEKHFDCWGEHCVAFTKGAELVEPIRTAPGLYTTFFKGVRDGDEMYSGMQAEEAEYGGKLADWLRGMGVTEIDIVGLTTEYCVKATALDAVKEGFDTAVLVPLVAAMTDRAGADALRQMEAGGVKVIRDTQRPRAVA